MSLCQKHLITTCFLLATIQVHGQSSLNGSIGQETVYFSSEKRLRHHSYHLDLYHTSELSNFSKIVIEGQASYDLTVSPLRSAARSAYSTEVKNDEVFNSNFTSFYLNHLGSFYSLKIGLQPLAWIETLTQQGPEFLIPIDTRRGGLQTSSTSELPIPALRIGHKFFNESYLEWIYVAAPVVSRLPKGKNGYGYIENLENSTPRDRSLVLSERKPPSDFNNAEFGVRLIKTIENLDLSLFGYHGHQRIPSYKVQTALASDSLGIEQNYPKVDTYGFFSSWSESKLVSRFFVLYEPERAAEVQAVGVGNQLIEDSGAYKHSRIGLGVDYAFSRHLKVYTEGFVTRLDAQKDREKFKKYSHLANEEYALVYRLTNETYINKTLNLEGMITFPERSYLVSPSVNMLLFKDYKLSAGLRQIKSFSDRNRLDMLRESSHYFMALDYSFKVPTSP